METEGDSAWSSVELADGSRRKMTRDEIQNHKLLPSASRVYQMISLLPAQYRPNQDFTFEYEGRKWPPPKGSCWKTDRDGMEKLAAARRLQPSGNTLRYVLFNDDNPYSRLTSLWSDLGPPDKVYVVQTANAAVQRCMLASTDPGDLVIDPTCGGGTTAYVAETWGRRWITCDVSRVPLALARQRLLTATYDWHELQDDQRGPAGGFVYKRKQNSRGEEVGGIVPHVTLGSIANSEPSDEEILVDRPERRTDIVRVTGPFTFEATIPTPIDIDGDGIPDTTDKIAEDYGSFVERMLEVLRRSPILRLTQNRTVTMEQVRPPAKTLSLSAEAIVKNGVDKPVAIVFGPENGAVSEKLVFEAAREANAKRYSHLYVFGFAIQPNARELIDNCEAAIGVPATYVQATPDLLMGDLLKNMRSSQIFSVCGLPEVEVRKVKAQSKENGPAQYEVELFGIDSFDPITMQSESKDGSDVPAWFLDCDYNGLCFKVSQAFFPKTGAWESLKKALKADYEESVWEHLAGTTSAPFSAGEHKKVAVKVVDERGNELMVVRDVR
jgi:adenine-specific DNA-methyltransferase